MDRAVADFDKAIAINPRLTTAYNNRGIARLEQTRLSEALSDFDKAIGMDSVYALAYLNRGLVLELQGKMAEADKDFQRCLEINPNLKQLQEERRKEVARKHKAQR